jgi:hypothetical protein
MKARLLLIAPVLAMAAPVLAQTVQPATPAATPAPATTPTPAANRTPVIITPGKAGEIALPGAAPPPKPEAPGEVSHDAPVNGVLVLFGNQKCPTDAQGNEVVVCTRRNAQEQYRIPKEMRDFKVTPQNEAWAARLQPVMTAGDAGVNSCSTVGPGGQTGCFLKQAQADRQENRERKADEAAIP